MTFPDGDDKEPLDLEQQIVADPPEIIETPDDEEGEPFVGFADEIDEEAEQTPLVQKLRAQIRKLSRKPSHTNDDDDPEPVIPDRPDIEKFGWDVDKFQEATDAYVAAKEKHGEWKGRQGAKSAQREAEQVQTVKRIQQQAKQLGVVDFDAREERVRDAMSPIQLKAIVQYAENPAAMIAALGGSQTKLDELSSVDDPAMFMKMLGRIELSLKVGKRKAPEPEARVRGGNAVLSAGADKELERLEREADKTGDRSKVIRYKREMRQAAA